MLPHDSPFPAGETWTIPENFIYHDGGIESSFFIPGDSPWFSGHFPGMPILPAIGMLGMVYDTLSEYSTHHGIHLTIREIKRVRFRQVLKPQSRFNVIVSIEPSGDGFRGSFQCMSENEKVCDGTLVVSGETLR